MKSLKLEPSANTYTYTARAYAWNKNNDLLIEELEKARNIGIQFGEIHIMEILKTLAVVSNYEPVAKVSSFC